MATKQVLRNGENREEKPNFHQNHSPQRMEGRDREFGLDIHTLLYLKHGCPTLDGSASPREPLSILPALGDRKGGSTECD